MLRRVALVRTDVSEELSAPIIRVTRIGELGTLAVTSQKTPLFRLSRFLIKFQKNLELCPCSEYVSQWRNKFLK
jgi:hypothetical protein